MEILDELWLSRHKEDKLFLEIIKGYKTHKSIEYPDTYYIYSDDIIFIKYETNLRIAFIDVDILWNKLRSNFNLAYNDTFSLFNRLISTHLNLKDFLSFECEMDKSPSVVLYE